MGTGVGGVAELCDRLARGATREQVYAGCVRRARAGAAETKASVIVAVDEECSWRVRAVVVWRMMRRSWGNPSDSGRSGF